MADLSDPKVAAMKTRIINHMTTDHAESLSLYLQNYSRIPPSMIHGPALADITFDHMIISHSAGRNLIPFDPPLKSFAETRERVVQMHKESLSALDLSEIKVDSFALPSKAWQWITHAVCILCFTTLSPFLSHHIVPSTHPVGIISKIWSVGGFIPQLAAAARYLATYTFIFMIVVHGVEATYMAKGRLRKHQVAMGSRVWWAWFLGTYNGGVACFTRFDEMIKEKESEKNKKSKAGNH